MRIYDSALCEMVKPEVSDCLWIADKVIQANMDIWGSYLPPDPETFFGIVYCLMLSGI